MTGKKWTKEDVETLRLGYTLKTSIKQIAELVKREVNAVMTKAHRLGFVWGEGEVEGSDEPKISYTDKNETFEDGRRIMDVINTACVLCEDKNPEGFWGYGRWTFDTEKCAKTHLEYEQVNGPCQSDRIHQPHDGRDNHMVGIVGQVGRAPVLVPYSADPMNKRPRRDLAHQKLRQGVSEYPSTTLPKNRLKTASEAICDCEAPDHCEKCE